MTRFVLVLVLVLCLLHPFADPGSDSDDALEIGWRELLAGRSPWACRTHLGNRLTPTLGGLIVSWPAAVVGAEWLGLMAALMLLQISEGGIVWALVVMMASKTICQGIDYLHGSSVLAWALFWAQRWHPGRVIGRRGPSC